VELAVAKQHLDEHGYVVLPAFLTVADLAAARAAIAVLYPTVDEFHDDVDPERNAAFRKNQFVGIVRFPFADPALSLFCVNDKLLDLVERMLDTDDIRMYDAEAWAKYTDAVDYDQMHHRDFRNHTILVPSDDPAFRQLELFVYVDDVTEDLGPTHVVPSSRTDAMPAVPNHFARDDHPDHYDAEVSAAGPAGTVLVYTTNTFHRGTNLTKPRGGRFTIHLNFRPASVEWAQRQCWIDVVEGQPWRDFVNAASPRQLALVGWPPPGHPYWTPHTLTGLALRYPGRDLTPWA
jgi:ectoine hydroxylase-related dioxygenase (phytanoyl-CoA dioxygenase family)